MTFICCVPGCGERGKRIFHSFPKDTAQCKLWIEATWCWFLNEETAWKSHYKVCRKHFVESDFKNWNLLKKDVIPSMILPHSITMEHDYCVRNSNLVANNYAENESEASTGNENVEQICVVVESSCPDVAIGLAHSITIEHNYCMQNSMVADNHPENDSEASTGNEIGEQICVVLESRGPGVAIGSPYTITLEHDSCERKSNLVADNHAENDSVASTDNERVAEICVMLDSSVHEHVMESEEGSQIQGEKRHELGLANITYENVENVLVESLDDKTPSISKPSAVACAQQNFKQKRPRTYDPTARKIKYLLNRNRCLVEKLKANQPATIKSHKKSAVKKKIDGVLNTLLSELPPEQYNFIKLQLKNTGKAKKGNRFSFEDKTLALVIYKQNPKRYKDLRKISNLPTRQTLIAHSAAIRFKEGINQNLMDFIKKEVSEMADLDKICTIGWDEMSLTANLDFDHIKDYIDGFEDLSSKRTNNFATHGLVFMIRGVKSAYKQPVSYFLTENLKATELAELVKLVIIAVLDTGLKVIGSVCDAVNTNRSAVNKLIDRKGFRVSLEGELLEYTINGLKIWHYFDPPHLIKSVRNNLLVKNLIHTVSFNETKFKPSGTIVWNEKNKQQRTATWIDIVDFYEFNNNHNNGLFNLIPKITEEHMNPERRKMKVSLATQVFSGTYGRNMYLCWKRQEIANNCLGTAAALLFFNDIFDSMNGDDIPVPDKLIGSVTPNSKHFHFWDYAERMLQGMKYSENLRTGKPNKSNVFKHIVSTLKAMQRICEHLFELGFVSVGLRRLNQDGLENHFFKIRSNCGSNPKPNARDFRNAYTTSVLNNQLSSHSLKANCEPDKDSYILQNLEVLFTQQERASSSDSILHSSPAIVYGDPNKSKPTVVANGLKDIVVSSKSFVEDEAENCISGKICKILLKKMKCISCAGTVTATKKDKSLDVMRKQSSVDEMVLPKVEFINCIKILIAKLKFMLPHFCAEKNLMDKLLPGLSFENKNDEVIGCDLHRIEFINEMKTVTAKLAIRRFTLQVNRILSGKVTVATEPIMQKKALEFRSKKKHIGKFVPPVSSNRA